MGCYNMKVEAEAGRCEATQLVGAKAGTLRNSVPAAPSLNALPLGSEGLQEMRQQSGDMHTLWGQLSTFPQRRQCTISLSEPQFLVKSWRPHEPDTWWAWQPMSRVAGLLRPLPQWQGPEEQLQMGSSTGQGTGGFRREAGVPGERQQPPVPPTWARAGEAFQAALFRGWGSP